MSSGENPLSPGACLREAASAKAGERVRERGIIRHPRQDKLFNAANGHTSGDFGRPIVGFYLDHFLSIIYANLLSKLVQGFIEGPKGNIR